MVLPHIVYGTVYDIFGIILSGASVTLTHPTITPVLTATSDSNGVYNFNLGNLDAAWKRGDAFELSASKEAEGRITVSTTISSGGSQTENLTLAETSDFDYDEHSEQNIYALNMSMPVHYDGEKVTRQRPFPVSLQNFDNLYDELLQKAEDTSVTQVSSNVNELQNAVILLRRIVKLLDSNAVVDTQNRQKLHLAFVSGYAWGVAIAAGSAGVGSFNGATAGAPVQSIANIWIPVWPGPIDPRFIEMDKARNTYANGIRANLIFS
jgi:hypothetical protein